MEAFQVFMHTLQNGILEPTSYLVSLLLAVILTLMVFFFVIVVVVVVVSAVALYYFQVDITGLTTRPSLTVLIGG